MNSNNFFQLVADFQKNIDWLNQVLKGDEQDSVNIDGTVKPSISKDIADKWGAISAMVQGRAAYETKASLPATPPQGVVLAEVWRDSAPENNGLYGWTGSAWEKSPYDTISNIVNLQEATSFLEFTNKQREDSIGYRDSTGDPYAIVDSKGYKALSITDEGWLSIYKMLMDAKSQREDGNYPFKIEDVEGKVAFGIDKKGVVNLFKLLMTSIPVVDRENKNLVFSIDDSSGSVCFGIGDDGSLFFPEFKMPVERKREDGGVSAFSIRDQVGNVLLGINNKGELDFQLSKNVKDQIEKYNYISPVDFDSDDEVFNVRESDCFSIASVQESDGAVFDIKKLKSSDTNTSLIDRKKPVEVILVSGQSNAGGGGNSYTLLEGPIYPHNIMTYNGLGVSGHHYADGELLPSKLTDIIPLKDAPVGGSGASQYAATMMSYATEFQTRKHGFMSPGYLVATTWWGSQDIYSFLRGTSQWNSLMTLANSSPKTMGKYARKAYCPAYVFVQGESGPSGRDVYGHELSEYVDDVVSEIAINTGQPNPPEFFLYQINTGENQAPDTQNEVDLGQLDVAKNKFGSGVTLVGPMYQCPFYDAIHPNAIGRMVQGDLFGVVYNVVVNKKNNFEPLWPKAISKSGKEITVTFSVPAGDLAWDDSWVPSVPNYGFRVKDDSDSAVIESVKIVGSNQVLITLSSEQTGDNLRLQYAQPQSGSIVSGWASGRGQLISPTSVKSLYHELGYDVPEMINHYCVRFDELIK